MESNEVYLLTIYPILVFHSKASISVQKASEELNDLEFDNFADTDVM